MADAEERFWRFVEKTDGCWIWHGFIKQDGYGQYRVNLTTTVLAHRYSYILAKGDIPDGLEIDHLCRNRCCVNPAHMEAVTHAENVRRGEGGLHNRLKTHCPRGHEFNEANTYHYKGWRYCRECNRERKKKRRESKIYLMAKEGS